MYLQVKLCPSCKTEKSTTEFFSYSSACKPCYRARKKRWAKNNKDLLDAQVRRHNWKKNFGLNESDYYKMLAEHNNVCAICHKTEDTLLSVDHCHSSGKIRGLLCKKCNLAIGHFEDQIERLTSAIEYLKKYQ